MEVVDGKSTSPLTHPCFSRGPLPCAGYFCMSSSIWPLIHHCFFPECPYMGKAGEEELLARGNPVFPEVMNQLLVQTVTDFPRGRKVKLRLFVPSGCQKRVFALQTDFQLLLLLTPFFPTGRDVRDHCPLTRTEESTQVSAPPLHTQATDKM